MYLNDERNMMCISYDTEVAGYISVIEYKFSLN